MRAISAAHHSAPNVLTDRRAIWQCLSFVLDRPFPISHPRHNLSCAINTVLHSAIISQQPIYPSSPNFLAHKMKFTSVLSVLALSTAALASALTTLESRACLAQSASCSTDTTAWVKCCSGNCYSGIVAGPIGTLSILSFLCRHYELTGTIKATASAHAWPLPLSARRALGGMTPSAARETVIPG